MDKKIVIVSKGAGGKDFLKNKLVKIGFIKSVSYTTRPPRSNEIDGVDYYFISKEDFIQGINTDVFFEWSEFNGWYYCNTYNDWNNSQVFIKTPAGISKLGEHRKDCFIIYLDIPEEIRRERLQKRNDADNVDRRIEADELDFENFTDYDIRITNPNF